MIFVTVGSQKFQFDRLLRAVDEQIAENKILDLVFAQIGDSNYRPANYSYSRYLDRIEFDNMQNRADIVITHGGTGAIIGAVKKGKKVIAVPRLSKYGEHVDDHQIQLVRQFSNLGLIIECDECEKISEAIKEAYGREFQKYESNTVKIIESIENYINNQT